MPLLVRLVREVVVGPPPFLGVLALPAIAVIPLTVLDHAEARQRSTVAVDPLLGIGMGLCTVLLGVPDSVRMVRVNEALVALLGGPMSRSPHAFARPHHRTRPGYDGPRLAATHVP